LKKRQISTLFDNRTNAFIIQLLNYMETQLTKQEKHIHARVFALLNNIKG